MRAVVLLRDDVDRVQARGLDHPPVAALHELAEELDRGRPARQCLGGGVMTSPEPKLNDAWMEQQYRAELALGSVPDVQRDGRRRSGRNSCG